MKEQVYEHCQNCGTRLKGDYCYRCGQRANEPRRAVIGLVQDVFVDTLWIDGRLLRSIGLLLWKPGRLARRYLDGRRQHYTPPFRMYLFASVFYFFLLFWIIGSFSNSEHGGDFWRGFEEGLANDEEQTLSVPGVPGVAITAGGPGEPEVAVPTDPAEEKIPSSNDAEGQDAPAGEAPSDASPSEASAASEGEEEEEGSLFSEVTDREFEDMDYKGPDWSEPHARKFFYGLQAILEEPRLFVASVQANLPRVMLLAPPLYALILALFYIYRRKYLFYDHLVVSLYMHGALYAYLLIAMVIDPIPVVKWLVVPLMMWAAIQPYSVLRQAYGSNWVSVILKGFLTTSIYNFLIFVLVLFGLSYSIYQV